MKFVSLVETTLGVLEVQTETVPWIWTILSFGFFRKVICRIRGTAMDRYIQIQKQESNKLGFPLPKSLRWDEEERVFYTIFYRVKLYHELEVEYVQAYGRVIADYHQKVQCRRDFLDALENGDVKEAMRLLLSWSRERERRRQSSD